MRKIVVLGEKDNVATSLLDIQPDTSVDVELDGAIAQLAIRDAIPFGHKIAIRPLSVGDHVLKYGEVIGRASRDIAVGEWVHIHNVESVRARGDL